MTLVITKPNQGDLKMDNQETNITNLELESNSLHRVTETDENIDINIPKKDPDETIILPNDDLKKWNNRNRNQPL